jgi:hypothetical protein
MSDNLDIDKIFAYTIASVKEIGDIIKDLMSEEYFHLALEFLEEEKKALIEAKKLLLNIPNKNKGNNINKKNEIPIIGY